MVTAVLGFTELEEIHRTPSTVVLRGVRVVDGKPVVLKTTSDRHPTPAQIAPFARERRLADKARGEYVADLLDALEHDGAPVLVIEDFGGASLDRVGVDMGFEERLQIALHTARAIDAVHARGVVHKDINPGNILFNRRTGALKLIDFGIATDLKRETPTREGTNLEGTLRYIAPEQTGRMNRSVDRRSDLYSLGATLYELFAGRPPFEGSDPLELVHAHVARPPRPLSELPGALANIVMRLLSKSPDERYQTAAGLVADLERCAKEFAGSGRVPLFELGAKDRSGAVEVPQKLYGRSEQVKSLFNAFGRAVAGGRELVLVAGSPGIGKTSLVHEVYGPIAETRGDLLEGKFDAFRVGAPYAPLGRAFGRFLRRVLTRDDESVAAWREKLARALGRNAGLLVEIMPELASLLGPQEVPQELAAAEAENRFHLVFRALIEALATRDHPVALFLDDLQWADIPTLRLLERIATDADSGYLLVIGAYRDNELDAGHPLRVAIDNIRRAGVEPTTITLDPLTPTQVGDMLRDTFLQSGPEVDALAEECNAKTHGNPFFLRRFVEALGERGVVAWHPSTQSWTWRIEDVRALPHADNVVEFLADRVKGLPAPARVALQYAACIGDVFELRLLAAATGRSPAALQGDLRPAVEAELVAPSKGWILDAADDLDAIPEQAYRYRFVHDRIHQAAYTSMDPRASCEAHHRLGTLIEARHDASDEGAWRFEVVNHLNKAVDLVVEASERRALAQRNLAAGRRAMRAAAFGPAAGYLEAGIAMLAEDAWSNDYELALDLHADAAECAYVNAEFDSAESHILAVRAHARTLLDRIKALEIGMEARLARGELLAALEVALDALSQLGVDLPKNPGDAEVGAAVQRALGVLATVSTQEIAKRAHVSDPVVAAAQRILVRASSVAYYAMPALLPIIACEMVVTSVEKGLSTATPFAFAVLGIVMNAIGMLPQAHEYGVLAEQLIDAFEDRHLEARTRLVVNNNVCTWIEPLDDRLDKLRETYRIGRDTGDFEYAAIAGQSYATNAFSAGRELARLAEDGALFAGFMANYGQSAILRLHQPLLQLVRCFSGGSDTPARLDGPDYDEDEACKVAEASGSASLVFVTLSDMLVARYHFGSAREAFEVAERARPYQPGAASTYHLVTFHTYAPIAASKLCDSVDASERTALLAKIDESVAQLGAWAAAGPVNHRHRLLMVQAERARVAGETEAAATLFHEALEAVRQTAYVNEEALIGELTARFYLARGGVFRSIGRAFLQDAAFSYQRWGAAQKVTELRDEFPLLLSAARAGHAEETRTSITGSASLDIDGVAVVRAARSISAEIELDKLLATLFRTIVEAGGAQKAMLLLERGDRWVVAVEGTAAGEPLLGATSVDQLDPTLYPLSVLRYVLRTSEDVVIDDAADAGSLLDGDDYARSRGARSVLCIPVRHRGVLHAVLYLEHDEVAGVFTAQRCELLKLLMSQASVSLDNAMLFEAQARLTKAQSLFVPHQFLESLDRHDIAQVALGDAVARTLSVFVSDLRGFTTLAENMAAHEVIELLNNYFLVMEPCVAVEGGFIDSFQGDGIMALFEGPAERAVRAGVAMHAALARFNASTGRTLRMGTGVNTGPCVLGTVGGRDRIQCTVVGDSANVAHRIEGLTKVYSAPFIIGESTYDALPASTFSLRPVDKVIVKGREGAQTIYEVLDAATEAERAAKERSRPALEEAMALYYARDFDAAAEGFAACSETAPTDVVPGIFLQRCRAFGERPPPDDWQGAERLTSK